MSIGIETLETLCGQLRDLENLLSADARAPGTVLDATDQLVVAARACDFMLPSPLTLEELSSTVGKKIETVDVLLQRARMHESLPADARAAAEEENMFMEDDYRDAPALPGSGGGYDDSADGSTDGGNPPTAGEFAALLGAEGFCEVVTVEREAGGTLDDHSHPFEAKALVLHGELHIRSRDGERRYAAGDVFHLQAGCPHSERYGDVGVTYLVGRKSPDPA